MSIAALLALASTAISAEPGRAPARGVELATAQVRAEVLRPAIVHQDKGLEDAGPDAPRPHVSRREGTVLLEIE